MKRYIIVVPAYILLAAAGPIFPTEEQQAKIGEPYYKCIKNAAERTDDGRTDFQVEIKSVAKVCKSEFTKMIAILSKDLSSKDRKAFEKSQFGRDLDYAATAVGRVRATKQGNPVP